MAEQDFTPEKRQLRLGYIPLTDCLPLVVAREKGFFAEQGLDVELCREVSWANLRDKLTVGQLDGAQMLAPMPLASSLGLGGLRKPMVSAFALGLNGNAITVSNALFTALQSKARGESALHAAQALAAVVAERRRAGREPLVFAMVFPFSAHNYLLRQWLAAGGIDADSDIKLVALPPAQMVDNLKLGHIDGYCVGEPWNSYAVASDLGRCLVSGYEIWQNAPEKVLAVTEHWLALHPASHAAILRALARACAWADEHPEQALALLEVGYYLDLSLDCLSKPLKGELRIGLLQRRCHAAEFHVFHRYQANFPWRSHADWFLRQMYRWGQLGGDIEVESVSERVYRSDIYRDVLSGLLPMPAVDRKEENTHRGEWGLAGDAGELRMGPDLMIGHGRD